MSLKNKNAKSADKIKLEQSQVTIEQHLNNLLFAIKNATMTGEQHQYILASFMHIKSLLIKEEAK